MNYYHLWMQSAAARALYDANRSEFYGQINRINQLVHGIGDGTMAHGEAWEFFRLGKYLERACQTARILDVKYHILLPTPTQVGTPVDQRPLGRDPDQLLGLRAVPQEAAAARRYRRRGGRLPDLRPAFPAFGGLLPGRVPSRRLHAIAGRPAGEPGNEVERLSTT